MIFFLEKSIYIYVVLKTFCPFIIIILYITKYIQTEIGGTRTHVIQLLRIYAVGHMENQYFREKSIDTL